MVFLMSKTEVMLFLSAPKISNVDTFNVSINSSSFTQRSLRICRRTLRILNYPALLCFKRQRPWFYPPPPGCGWSLAGLGAHPPFDRSTCYRKWNYNYHKENKVRANLLLSLFIDGSVSTRFQRSVVIFLKWSTKTVGNFS